jgi:hypothetical protein
MTPEVSKRFGALAGFVVVIANIAAVAFLAPGAPSAYHIDEVGRWLDEIRAAPPLSELAALLFAIGTLALLPLANGLRADLPQGAARSVVVVGMWIAGLANGIGAPLVIVASRLLQGCIEPQCIARAHDLVVHAIELDALFNAALGVAFIALAAAATNMSKWMRGTALTAGLLCLPVALQFTSALAGRLVSIAGPVWLLAVAALSARLLMKARAPTR